MRFKNTSFLTRVIFILITIIISFSLSACDSRDAEIQVLQQQVEMLATQNPILIELRQESTSVEVADEVVAPSPPTVEQDVQVEIVEPTPDRLPDGPVPAGTTVIYDGWALTLENDINISRGKIYLTFVIRNITDNTKVFRYVKSGLKLSDNLGNKLTMDSWGYPDDFNITHQFSLNAGQYQNISCSRYYHCGNAVYLPGFIGQISTTTKFLVIKGDDWGPFNGVVFHMDL